MNSLKSITFQNQEEIENLNRPITSMEIKTVMKNLLTNKSPGPYGFTGEFYPKIRAEMNEKRNEGDYSKDEQN